MRLIYKHENRGLVYSIKNVLAMHDIDCQIKNDFANTMGAEFGISNTLLELWIEQDGEYERARKLIEEQSKPITDQENWFCKNCGEENHAQFALCWNCQTETV